MARKFWVVLAAGVILRIFLAATTFHPDVTAFQLGGMVVGSGNILNLYDYLGTLPASNTLVEKYSTALFIYPPAIYLFHGIFNAIYSFIPGLGLINDFVIVTQNTFGNWLFNIHLLILKMPYLLFDLPIAFLLMRLFHNQREKFLAFAFWIFNPVNLYATYMMGQFDVIATFFVVLALVLAVKGKLSWAALAIGGGIAFKLFPLYLLIPLVLMERKLVNQIKLVAIGVLPYILTLLPYLPSKGFRSSALVANHTLKSLYAQIPISGGEAILLFPLFVLFFYLVFYLVRGEVEELWKRFFISLILFFVFTHYHPQWFVWLTPFLLIDVIYSRFKTAILTLVSLLSFIGLLFFFDPSLTVGIFAPLFPSTATAPSLWQQLGINMDYTLWRSVLQTAFVSAAIMYIFLYFPKRVDEVVKVQEE